jgi:CHASE3 domain sensor protein
MAPMVPHRSFRAALPLGRGYLLLILGAAASIWLSVRQEEAVRWVRHALEVENRINLIKGLITRAESDHSGVLLAAQTAYLDPNRGRRRSTPSQSSAFRVQRSRVAPSIFGPYDPCGARSK